MYIVGIKNAKKIAIKPVAVVAADQPAPVPTPALVPAPPPAPLPPPRKSFLITKPDVPTEFPVVKLPAFEAAVLTAVAESLSKSGASQLSQMVINSRQSLKRYKEQVDLEEAALAKLEEQKKSAVSSAERVNASLLEIAATGLFENFEIEDSFIWCTTTSDAILTYGGKSINFGRFAVRVGLGQVTIVPFKNNIYLSGCYHPFISGGDVCWGHWAGQIATELLGGRLVDILASVHLLLNTYEADGKGRCPMNTWVGDQSYITDSFNHKCAQHPMARRKA
jgi:hypothetical protein